CCFLLSLAFKSGDPQDNHGQRLLLEPLLSWQSAVTRCTVRSVKACPLSGGSQHQRLPELQQVQPTDPCSRLYTLPLPVAQLRIQCFACSTPDSK
ncbi:hypothetical protein ATANTOWER_019613, partial [Ataeniobius toweri]|nr:hypothetical protein [Ataeniobius toweri]